MLTAALNPNHTKILLRGSWVNAPLWKIALNRWINFSQFVISTYAFSNTGTRQWTQGWIDMETRKMICVNHFKSSVTVKVQDLVGSPLSLHGLINRGMHVACLVGLYALHQYSKNTAYGLIGAMVMTKISSNIYIFHGTPKVGCFN